MRIRKLSKLVTSMIGVVVLQVVLAYTAHIVPGYDGVCHVLSALINTVWLGIITRKAFALYDARRRTNVNAEPTNSSAQARSRDVEATGLGEEKHG